MSDSDVPPSFSTTADAGPSGPPVPPGPPPDVGWLGDLHGRTVLCNGHAASLLGVRAEDLYATTLFDYIRRAMPYNESKSLTADEIYALSAYILALNGIVGASDVMDAQSLPKVKMPNKENFFVVYPGNLK